MASRAAATTPDAEAEADETSPPELEASLPGLEASSPEPASFPDCSLVCLYLPLPEIPTSSSSCCFHFSPSSSREVLVSSGGTLDPRSTRFRPLRTSPVHTRQGGLPQSLWSFSSSATGQQCHSSVSGQPSHSLACHVDCRTLPCRPSPHKAAIPSPSLSSPTHTSDRCNSTSYPPPQTRTVCTYASHSRHSCVATAYRTSRPSRPSRCKHEHRKTLSISPSGFDNVPPALFLQAH